MADRIGKEKVLVIGYAVFVISSLFMVLFTSNSFYAYLLAAVFGVYMGISDTLQRAIIPRYIASELRGTAYGIYNVVIGSSFFISNIVFGFLWDKYSLNIASYYSMTFALAGIIGMSVFIRRFPIGSASLAE
ncbi:MAG: MFS transporter [Thermoproteota archaeon]|nr:MFS transporter [Thermoproteota archaeon]